MPYKIKPTIRVSVPAEWADGLWIEVRNPRMLTLDEYGPVLEAQSLRHPEGGATTEGIRQLLTAFIVDWNVPPIDGSAPIAPLPSKDPGVWRNVPIEMISAAVMPVIRQGVRAVATPDPNS